MKDPLIPRSFPLITKLGLVGGTLLLVALVSVGLTLWMSWQLEGGAAAVNEAGRMRMETWRLAQALTEGDTANVPELIAQFDQSISLLQSGDPSRPLLVPQDKQAQAAFTDVQAGWATLRKEWASADRLSGRHIASQSEAFVRSIDSFVSAIEVHLARLTALLNGLQIVVMVLTLASAAALFYCASLFILVPLARLQAGLARIGERDFAARVETESADEFGAVSAGFNQMAETLQGLYHNLEEKVHEKTARLEAQRSRLSALYEAANFVGHATTLEEMANGFIQQLRRVAGADASALRWTDEFNERYLLLASDGLPQEVVSNEFCIPTGGCLCGQPKGDAAIRVIPIRTEGGADMLGHCDRAGYRTVVGIPVRLQERMVGELNLLYRTDVNLGDEDRELLETLANHLAVAIEGLRVGALEREAAVAEERALIARELHDSIAQSLAFLKIQLGLLRGALNRGDASCVQRTLGELDVGVHESLSDVRELLMHFRTRTNAEDITPALQMTLKKFEHQTGLTTHLTVEGHGLPLAPDVQVQVLHVVQEALSNVRKHAYAREVWVEVHQSPRWRIEVRDDGRGFDADRVSKDETHVGLRIMRERAQHIGATIDLTSVPGAGSCVALTLPERNGQIA